MSRSFSLYYDLGDISSEESHSNRLLKARIWQGLIVVAAIPMIILNYISATSQFLGGTDNAIISNKNPTYVTPDGGTFAIWSFIYLFELIMVVYQALPKQTLNTQLEAARPWIVAAFAANSLWLAVFAYLKFWLSVAVMLTYLGILIKIYRVMDIHYGFRNTIEGREVDWKLKMGAFTGFSLNMAWIAVASGVNATTALRQGGWKDEEYGVGANEDWAIMWAVIFGGIACILALRNGDVPYGLGTAWALAGISRMQTVENKERFPVDALSSDVALWADWMFWVVLAVTAVSLVKNLVEVFVVKGMSTAPAEVLEGEDIKV